MAFEENDSPQTRQKKVYEEEKKQAQEYQRINKKSRRASEDSNESSETPRSQTSESQDPDSSLNTSQSSEKSTKVIEFDEDGNILEGKRTTTIEMTDLKAPKANQLMREFVPAGKVNQSQKKREKRKLKKMEEERKEKLAEEEKARKAYEKAKKEAAESGKPLEPVQRLKKKVLPKQVIHDMEGDWEVVDKKQTVFVEEEADSDESVEEEKIVPRHKRMKNININ